LALLGAAAPRDTASDLERWSERLARVRPEEEEPFMEEGEHLAEQLGRETRMAELGRWPALEALLELEAAGEEIWRTGEPAAARMGARARELALRIGGGLLDDDLARRLASEVLLRREGRPARERAAAAALLSTRPSEEMRSLLVLAARDTDASVRETALTALVGSPSETVQARFVEVLRTADRTADARSLHTAEKNFRTVHLAPTSAVAGMLEQEVVTLLSSEDWREISRGAAVSRGLPDERAVPHLIDALSRWLARADADPTAPRVRIERDICAELERRSGRALGPHADRWLQWWRAVGEGRISPGNAALPQATSASFFGLHPSSDRVAFVLDRSGSMQALFRTLTGPTSTKEHTRYEAAVEELIAYLTKLGPSARFQVVLFDDAPEVWRKDSASATAQNLRDVRTWLLRHHPDGDTYLRRGIDAALDLDAAGRLHLERLQADSLVVLCDGATTEGPAWVEAVLPEWVASARLRFHCVQIGLGGDSTLQALAQESGGEFVRVEP
jgi:hypothetical protein